MKLNVYQAVLWSLGVFLATNLAILIVLSLKPHADPDPVAAAAVLSLVYLAASSLFAGRRPGRSWSDTFAVRRTSPWLLVFALLIGVASYLPAAALAEQMARVFPMPGSDKAFEPHSIAQKVLLFVFAGAVGPFAEELLFRGALYTGLRPQIPAPSAAWTTSLLFTLTHPEPRFWPSILALALLLGAVRAISGSLFPSVFMHIAFNVTALGMPFSSPRLENPSIALVLGSGAGALALFGVMIWIGRVSKSADQARRVDLEPDPGLGETLS
jgi:membrane protease YdiL (CAAX protease family)